MKKIISILLVALMLSAMFVMPASAAGNGAIAMTSATGDRGETVTLNINMPTNPGLVTMRLAFDYDTDVLELVSVTDTGLLKSDMDAISTTGEICWIDGATTQNNTATGTIATLTFEIKDDAAYGETEVALAFKDSYDVDTAANTFTATSGVVSVECAAHNVVKGFCTECGAYCGFPDVYATHWGASAIEFCARAGYITGHGSGMFGIDMAMEREDFVLILSRIAGVDLSNYTGVTTFPDVADPNAYYAKAVQWATENGIINGYTSGPRAGYFGTDDSLTREQLVTILCRYAKKLGVDTTATTGNDLMATYPDAGAVNPGMRAEVAWALENGVISGMQVDGKTSIAPYKSATRAQVAKILFNIHENNIIPGL